MVFQSSKIRAKTIGLGIQARLGSERFPRKIFANVEPKRSLLKCVLDRAFEFKALMKQKGWEVVIGVLCPQLDRLQISHHLKNEYDETLWIHGGDEKDVFSRYEAFFNYAQPEYLMRITADCPYWAPPLAHRLLSEMQIHKADFGWIKTPSHFPDGLDVEFIRHDLWILMEEAIKHEGIREHVTIGLKGTWEPLPEKAFILPKDDAYDVGHKLSIDTLKDLENIRDIREGIWWINQA
jgi:spore coat polysaccharide biosynthesis protein SpsF